MIGDVTGSSAVDAAAAAAVAASADASEGGYRFRESAPSATMPCPRTATAQLWLSETYRPSPPAPATPPSPSTAAATGRAASGHDRRSGRERLSASAATPTPPPAAVLLRCRDIGHAACRGIAMGADGATQNLPAAARRPPGRAEAAARCDRNRRGWNEIREQIFFDDGSFSDWNSQWCRKRSEGMRMVDSDGGGDVLVSGAITSSSAAKIEMVTAPPGPFRPPATERQISNKDGKLTTQTIPIILEQNKLLRPDRASFSDR